jgi:hypothetical protein
MAITLFITESYLKDNTQLNDLVQWDLIKGKANTIQDSYIQDILGSNYYVHLQNGYLAQTLNPDESQLVALIRPALAYRVLAQSLPFIHYQIKNKGVQTQRGDYSDPAGLEEIRYLKTDLEKEADFYEKRITNYLCENARLFPEYRLNNSTDIKPNRTSNDDIGLAFY